MNAAGIREIQRGLSSAQAQLEFLTAEAAKLTDAQERVEVLRAEWGQKVTDLRDALRDANQGPATDRESIAAAIYPHAFDLRGVRDIDGEAITTEVQAHCYAAADRIVALISGSNRTPAPKVESQARLRDPAATGPDTEPSAGDSSRPRPSRTDANPGAGRTDETEAAS